jgi:hypothetical protein
MVEPQVSMFQDNQNNNVSVSSFNPEVLDAPTKLRTKSRENSNGGIRIRKKSKENARIKSVNSKLSEYKQNINAIGRVAEVNELGKQRAQEIKAQSY